MDKRTQLQNQCRAVIHLCHQIANICADHIQMAAHHPDGIIDINGERTARVMEFLGDEMNGMDAVTDEDSWMDGIFDQAQKMWPVKQPERVL